MKFTEIGKRPFENSTFIMKMYRYGISVKPEIICLEIIILDQCTLPFIIMSLIAFMAY